ncbi:MAG: hypothetical protein IJ080_02220, partial [Oscillospiraceae bacterium]|nr:hypothetical protein [Oscillospiraceae bacterium]
YISEFEAFSRGGQIIAHKENALIVSMGTGTAFVMARRDKYDYLGGSGVGGGTLCGLSLLTTGEGNIYNIKDMTRLGNTSNVDLTVGDISVGDVGLPADLTAANFGKADIDDSEYDIAAGLANMIYQSVGVMAAFALKGTDVKTAVFVGAMSEFDVGAGMLRAVGGLHGYEFIMPRCGAFAGAYGCAVTGLGEDSITAAIEREMEKIRNGAGKY